MQLKGLINCLREQMTSYYLKLLALDYKIEIAMVYMSLGGFRKRRRDDTGTVVKGLRHLRGDGGPVTLYIKAIHMHYCNCVT